MPIIIATISVAIIGLLIGLMLVYVGNKFAVKVDEKEAAVRGFLPGNNCGGCGYAGCDALAAAIAKGDAPVNGCPVGGAPVAEKIGHIMGVEASLKNKYVAFVACSGDCQKAPKRANYIGVHDCQHAALTGQSNKLCAYGCLGFGSCAKACPFGAITIVDGLAKIDKDLCKSCGKCVAACPKNLIRLMPYDGFYQVRCASPEKGPAVKKSCSAGCIGCGICAKTCEHDAIQFENNIARVISKKCVGCGKCAEKCPAKVIVQRTPAPEQK